MPRPIFKELAESLNSCRYQYPIRHGLTHQKQSAFVRGKGVLKVSKLSATRIFPDVTTSFVDCQIGRAWNKRLQPFRTNYVKRKQT